MKHISTIVNAIPAGMLVLILLTTGLPNIHARAAEQANPIPTATAEPAQSRRLAVIESKHPCQRDSGCQCSPDRALIQLGVQSNGKTPKAVQASAATISQVIKAVSPGRSKPGYFDRPVRDPAGL
jgi:hypothetical protein